MDQPQWFVFILTVRIVMASNKKNKTVLLEI